MDPQWEIPLSGMQKMDPLNRGWDTPPFFGHAVGGRPPSSAREARHVAPDSYPPSPQDKFTLMGRWGEVKFKKKTKNPKFFDFLFGPKSAYFGPLGPRDRSLSTLLVESSLGTNSHRNPANFDPFHKVFKVYRVLRVQNSLFLSPWDPETVP